MVLPLRARVGLVLLGCGIAPSALAFDIGWVDGASSSGGCNKNTISAALADADAHGATHATIYVKPGTYTLASRVRADYTHTIRPGNTTCSGSAVGTVVVNAPVNARAFFVPAASTLTLVDMRIIGGQSTASGGSIYVTGGSVLTLDGVELDNGSADVNGGCLGAGAGAVLGLTDTYFYGCSALGVGGAVWTDGATLTYSGGLVTNSSAAGGDGGGLYLSDTTFTFTEVNISGNSVEGRGGGIYVEDSSGSLLGTSLTGNTATVFGGGLYAYPAGGAHSVITFGAKPVVPFTQSSISGNHSDYEGGGLAIYEASVTLDDATTLTENTADCDRRRRAPLGRHPRGADATRLRGRLRELRSARRRPVRDRERRYRDARRHDRAAPATSAPVRPQAMAAVVPT